MTWLEVHLSALRRLFDVLGESEHWTDDPDPLVAWMERTWLGQEHGRQAGKPVYDDRSKEEALPLLAELGLTGRIEPPKERYDQIIVLGASGIGLHRRLELVRLSGVEAAGLTVLAGLRPHEKQSRDGSVDELLAAHGRFAAAPGWSVPAALALRAGILAESKVDPLQAAAVLFPSETDLAELLLGKQWPSAHAIATTHGPPHPVTNELGQRDWTLREWSGDERIPVLRILNGPPVVRTSPDGSSRPARPTALSTFDEWLEEVAAVTNPTDVLAVVNQPHLGRVRAQLLDRLASIDMTGMRMDVAGCETPTDADLVLLLGEIPAWIRTG